MESLLIVGCGDIARRALPQLQRRYRVSALVRSHDPALAASGVELVEGDLDELESLAPLAGRAGRIAHLAPPGDIGEIDQRGEIDRRTRNLVIALESPRKSGAMLPQRLVYISTSGVYGDCNGEFVDETRPTDPQSARARRRLDAERALAEWGERDRVEIVILRAPGIYASDRLPLERLRCGTPALRAEDDVYTNHIHAEDLAAILVAALESEHARGIYNASDDSQMKMGDFLDLVADRTGLARPPRIPYEKAAQLLPAAQFSFMNESRRLVNRRMKTELGVRLGYPTAADGIPGFARAA
jgi:nucleoside-diphosphate-sugar epimerase